MAEERSIASSIPSEWSIIDFIHKGPWWTNRGILTLNLFLIIPLLTSTINGYDSSVVNGLQIVPEWQDYFHHPEGKALGMIGAAQNVGAFVGMPIAPLASDILGRRAALFIGSCIVCAGVLLQCLSKSIAMFIGARFVIGFGISFACIAAPLLITELSYPTQRAQFTSIFNSSWYSGSIIAAWACLAAFKSTGQSTWAWRIPLIIQVVGSFLQVVLIWFMPESPRWLVSKGRESQAARILARYHAYGADERDPLVIFEMAQIRHALRLERDYSNRVSWYSLIATPGNRRRMRIIIAIALFSQWSGNGLVSYYINLILDGVGITDAGEKAEINGGLQIWNLISAFAASLFVDKLGRRTLFIASNVGMLLTFAMWTLTTALFETSKNGNAAKATIPMIFLFYFSYDIAYTAMLVAYTLEILPFSIRAKGFAVMNMTICFTLAFNQFVNPWALDKLNWKYYIFYCAWLVFELVFVLRYVVETKGRTLEETATLFDGGSVPQEIVTLAGEAATVSMTRPAMLRRSRASLKPDKHVKDHTDKIDLAEIIQLEHSPTSSRV